MSVVVDFPYDFSTPNNYLVHKVLPGIAERTGATFNYIPVLLGGIFRATGNQAPMMAFAGIPAKMAYENLEFRRFIKANNIPFKMNPYFPLNTVMSIRGALVAKERSELEAYTDAVYDAMWLDEKKCDEADVLIEVLDKAGLDGKALVEGTQDQAIKDKLIENTEWAVSKGAFGLPTFFVGDEMFWGKERLGQLEDEIKKQSAA